MKLISPVKLGATIAALNLILPTMAPAQGDSLNKSDIVKVRMMADQDRAVAGTKVTVGVEFTMAPDWHIYWTNPGDTGMPTKVTFSVNGSPAPQVEAQYPVPMTFISPGDLQSFGYSDKITVLAEVDVPADAEGDFVVEAKSSYLMCADRCIKGDSVTSITLPVGMQVRPSAHADALAAAKKLLPGTSSLPEGVSVVLSADGNSLIAVWPASAGSVVGNSGKKAGGFMLYPDRVPGINWRAVEVTQANGNKPEAVASQGLTAKATYSVGDPAKAKGQPLKAVLVWTPVDATGKPGTTESAVVSVNQPAR